VRQLASRLRSGAKNNTSRSDSLTTHAG
jgi:hypothetical protein